MITRTYPPGSQWLYLKIYTGTKSAEQILIDLVKPFTKTLIAEKLITEYFFIRYSDPDFHIRLRLKLSCEKSFNGIFEKLNNYFTQALESRLIHKICIDTYIREIERYGEQTMDLSESWFCAESASIVSLLSTLKNADKSDEEDKYRWLVAIRIIGDLLENFDYSLTQKFEMMERIKGNFCNEFGIINADFYKPLNNKSREFRKEIHEIMNGKGDVYNLCAEAFTQRATALQPISQSILEVTSKSETKVEELIPSYIHMSMNRLFRNHNRKCELVVYYLLDKYYLSITQQQKKTEVL